MFNVPTSPRRGFTLAELVMALLFVAAIAVPLLSDIPFLVTLGAWCALAAAIFVLTHYALRAEVRSRTATFAAMSSDELRAYLEQHSTPQQLQQLEKTDPVGFQALLAFLTANATEGQVAGEDAASSDSDNNA